MCYVDTKKISDKSTYQIVTIKGLCSGFGSVRYHHRIDELEKEIKVVAGK